MARRCNWRSHLLRSSRGATSFRMLAPEEAQAPGWKGSVMAKAKTQADAEDQWSCWQAARAAAQPGALLR